MMSGWRRAFCTSIPKDREKKRIPENQHDFPSPAIRTTAGSFSNPSTPRLQSQPVSSPSILCRPSSSSLVKSLPSSPKLQCKATCDPAHSKRNSPVSSLFSFSNPSSPKSPSSFSLLKSTLRLNKSSGGRCGVCLQIVKSAQGTAIFTAECTHSFHFSCLAAHPSSNRQHKPLCPVCGLGLKEASLTSQLPRTEPESKIREVKTKSLRVYNDDEPLASFQISLAQFNPIPESDENSEVEEDGSEFKGFFGAKTSSPLTTGKLEVTLSPESAIVDAGRGQETCISLLKVKAPQFSATRGARRAPIDLVMVVDLSEDTTACKIPIMRRAMRLVVSCLRDADRLSIIVFSSNSKRLMPLRRMTVNGRRSARRIVDAMVAAGKGMSVNDALKKAVKVVEDRREKNVVTRIIVLSNCQDSSAQIPESHRSHSSFIESTMTRLAETPVHTVSIKAPGACDRAVIDAALHNCFTGLLSVPVQDVQLQLGLVSPSTVGEISSVYSISSRPVGFEPGSIYLGDLNAEEERGLLVEVKIPASSSTRSHNMMTVRSSYVDPTSQEQVYQKQTIVIPKPRVVRSSTASRIRRIRNLHISSRALAESRRLIERDDIVGAYQFLSSARAQLVRSSQGGGEEDELVRRLEAEIATVNGMRSRSSVVSEKTEPPPITPTSAWRAAERLAKVAMMRKHMNRVSDLHGFENARF